MLELAPVASISPALVGGFGRVRAQLHSAEQGTQSVIFTVGNPGERLGRVTVTIRDETGAAIAHIALPALNGMENVIWTAKPGQALGAFAAYWEGKLLASPE